MTPRFAGGLRDLPAVVRRWGARPVRQPRGRAAGVLARVSLAAVALLLAPACASTAQPEPPTTIAEARLVSGREIASDLGLSARPVDGAGRRVLSRGTDARIVFYDGSPLISVRGKTLRAPVPVEFVDGDAWVDAQTAGEIDRAFAFVGSPGTAWRGTDALPPSPNAGLPPPPRRPTISGRPALPRPGVAVETGPETGASLSNRPSDVELRAWSVPLRRSWQYLVMHHSATDSGSAASFHAAHKKKGWNGLGYDFVIGNGNGAPDGLVEVGYRWRDQTDGAHAGDKLMNQRGIGICLVGDFTRTRPTPRQMRSLERLTSFLSRYCGIPPQNVRLHRDFRDTECPGTYFPRHFVAGLQLGHGARTGHHADAVPGDEPHVATECGCPAPGGREELAADRGIAPTGR